MTVEIVYVKPVAAPISEVICTPGAWPDRKIRVVNRDNFGTVQDTVAFSVAQYNETRGKYVYGSFACLTKAEAQEFIDAVQAIINQPTTAKGEVTE